ncbi:MAG: TdeIII family type II restriction endonuclease [Holosporales bacterium]|nr:TdeIII family type II restriction endonuclease [Holosporales bacterium]
MFVFPFNPYIKYSIKNNKSKKKYDTINILQYWYVYLDNELKIAKEFWDFLGRMTRIKIF